MGYGNCYIVQAVTVHLYVVAEYRDTAGCGNCYILQAVTVRLYVVAEYRDTAAVYDSD